MNILDDFFFVGACVCVCVCGGGGGGGGGSEFVAFDHEMNMTWGDILL